jgi:predicted nucleic acid-binding protein
LKTVVVDASAAVCWFVREAASPAANQLIRDDVTLIAPSLILAEVANAVWKKQRRGQMEPTQAEIAIREIHRFIPEIVELAGLIPLAAKLARETDHSVYDCLYVALARQRDAPLVTLDHRLVAAFASTNDAPYVVSIYGWLQQARGA